MPKGFPARNSRFTLRHRVNLLLAERGAPMRIVEARNNAERAILGEYYFVGHPNRHVIVRDHVDLYRFADEIGALRPGEKIEG
jgi:hypothetical protein